jgi:peptidylprolyl isomerase
VRPTRATAAVHASSVRRNDGWRHTAPRLAATSPGVTAQVNRPPRDPATGGRRVHSPPVPLERPQIDKPTGDIPFELGIEDIVVGEGDEATAGKTVSVHYAGVAFRTGEEFDASWNRGEPFSFKLGKGQVIPGWDAGVQGMRVGGRRKLTIPSAMGYGARGAGGVIAPHEPLVFVVDLLAVE